MEAFVDWVKKGGFWLNRTWNPLTNDFVHAPGKMILFPTQERVLEKVLRLDEDTGKFPYETILYSAPKKSGKTALGAAIGSWFSEQSYDGTEIYVLANDMEQAEGRMMRAIKYDANRKGWGDDHVHRYDISYPSGTMLQVLSSHYTSAAGGQQALTLWDELWGYQTEKSQRLWEEMTPIPTEKISLRVVVTYAGFEGESHLLWDLYEKTVINGKRLSNDYPDLPCYEDESGTIFAYWDHEPRLPWQTPEYYTAQMAQLRPIQFRRLHLNEWGSMEDIFVPIELWDKSTVLEGPLPYLTGSSAKNYPISVGVDVGVKRDSSAVVGVYVDLVTSKICLAFHRIWKPSPGRPINPKDIQDYVELMCKELKVTSVLCDPTHFHQNITEMKAKGLPVTDYNQSPSNMVAASMSLFEALQSGMIQTYLAADLRDHVRFAAAKPQGTGYRIIKSPDNPRANDGAIAMAMAVHDAVERGGYDTSDETVIRSPFSDATGFEPVDEADQSFLPEALRDS